MCLVNKVVTKESLHDSTMELAGKIASKSSMTVTIGKHAFYEQREMGLAQAYDYASNVMVENMLTYDAQEGMAAFIEKRVPKWQDK